MSQSSMVTRQWWANGTNYTVGRQDKIRGIVIHHAASTSLDSIGQVFSQPGRGGSAHYGVGGKQVHQYVREEDTAWHCLPVDATEVMTPQGFVPLSEMQVGDPVYQWNKDTGEITPTTVQNVIKPRIETVFRMRETEATAEHKIAYHTYDNPEVKLAKWGERLNTQTYFPDEFSFNGRGLPLTDCQIRLLVAVQADGTYIKDTEQVRFQFRKSRKIERLKEILKTLSLEYRQYSQRSGEVIVINNLVSFCEQYLDNKQFSYKLLDLGQHQMEVFAKELPYWDGTISDKTTFYCSSDTLSADVAQIIIFLSGRQSNMIETTAFGRKVNSRITLTKNNKYMFDRKTETTSRETVVSCISVPDGFIIVRQYGRVQIIGNCSNWAGNNATIGIETTNSTGAPDWKVSDETFDTLCKLVAEIAKRNGLGKLWINPDADFPALSGHKDWQGAATVCPGPYLYPKLQEICDRANEINYPTKKAELVWTKFDKVETYITTRTTHLYDFNHTHAENIVVIKEFAKDTAIDIYGKVENKTIGKTFLLTEYSFTKKITNGFKDDALIPKPAPQPQPQPAPEAPEKPQDEPKDPEPVIEPVEPENPQEEPVISPEDNQSGLTEEEMAKIQAQMQEIENNAKEKIVMIPMSNKTYDILKIVAIVILPLIQALYVGLSKIWGFGFGTEIDQTIQLIVAALNTVLGAALVKSSSDYHKGD